MSLKLTCRQPSMWQITAHLQPSGQSRAKLQLYTVLSHWKWLFATETSESKCWWGCGKPEHLYNTIENGNRIAILKRYIEVPQKLQLPSDAEVSLLFFCNDWNQHLEKLSFITTLLMKSEMQTNPADEWVEIMCIQWARI